MVAVGCQFDTLPLFFVSVASKGLSKTVSLLFATLAGSCISVAAKGLMGAKCWRGSKDLGRVGRLAMLAQDADP